MKNHNLTSLAILLAMILGLPAAASAQDANRPYSRFGYGLLNDNATAAQSQMGGTGYAMRSGRQINVMNPASYAMTDSLTFLFDMGLNMAFINNSEGNDTRHSMGGGLDYLTMQFPLGKRMGMSLGLLPYSSVGYSFGSKIDNGSSSHEGVGGLNLLNVGIAGRIIKNLSVGMNFGYLFGSTYHDVYASGQSGSVALFEQVMQVRDFHMQFGAQYSVSPVNGHRITAGLTYSPAKTLLGHTWIQKYLVNTNQTPDTLDYSSLKGRYSLPETWGAGIGYEWEGGVTAEFDFTYQPWSKVKMQQTEGFVVNRFADRYKYAVGASWQPRRRGTYLQRITYRIGGHLTRDYMTVTRDNESLNVTDFGISCGLGLPAPSAKTVINLGFEWLHRGTKSSAVLSENYFNIRLGINFNQMWFMQSQLK